MTTTMALAPIKDFDNRPQYLGYSYLRPRTLGNTWQESLGVPVTVGSFEGQSIEAARNVKLEDLPRVDASHNPKVLSSCPIDKEIGV